MLIALKFLSVSHCVALEHKFDRRRELVLVSIVRVHTSARFGVLITFCFYSNVFYFKARSLSLSLSLVFFPGWIQFNILAEITANLTFSHSAYRSRAACFSPTSSFTLTLTLNRFISRKCNVYICVSFVCLFVYLSVCLSFSRFNISLYAWFRSHCSLTLWNYLHNVLLISTFV